MRGVNTGGATDGMANPRRRARHPAVHLDRIVPMGYSGLTVVIDSCGPTYGPNRRIEGDSRSRARLIGGRRLATKAGAEGITPW